MFILNEKNLELVKKLRYKLHENPELSNEESWTKQYVIDFLKKHTKLEIVDKGNWFYAIYSGRKSKKNIAFRADFDALPMDEAIDIPYGSKVPGVSHKCGHDGHTASLVGFALEVDQKGAEDNIFFLFQHAEETGDGAKECVAMIKERNIDEIFAYHNMSNMPYKSVNVIDETAQYASKGMIINMNGSPTHASQPELGKNPSLGIANLISSIPKLISPENNEGVVLCTVVQVDVGEKAFGMSASNGKLLLTIRAQYEKELNKLQESLENIAKFQGEKYGLETNFEYQDEFPETFNHKESNDKIRQVCKEKNIKLVEMEEAFRGSEDFGHYTKLTKGAICYIGNGMDYPPLHTYEYDFPNDIIETAVELFKGLIGL